MSGRKYRFQVRKKLIIANSIRTGTYEREIFDVVDRTDGRVVSTKESHAEALETAKWWETHHDDPGFADAQQTAKAAEEWAKFFRGEEVE